MQYLSPRLSRLLVPEGGCLSLPKRFLGCNEIRDILSLVVIGVAWWLYSFVIAVVNFFLVWLGFKWIHIVVVDNWFYFEIELGCFIILLDVSWNGPLFPHLNLLHGGFLSIDVLAEVKGFIGGGFFLVHLVDKGEVRGVLFQIIRMSKC